LGRTQAPSTPPELELPWRRYSPRGALMGRFTCRPRPRIMVGNAPAIGTPTRARPSVRRHARRHRTCATAVVKPRSTPEGACFMTSPDATVTSTAREVTFYLAVRSPSVPACLPLVPSLTRHRSAVGLVLGPPPAPFEARSRSHEEHSVLIRSGPRSIAPSSSLRYYLTYALSTC